MRHIRTDNNDLNKDSVFACGIPWPLPASDTMIFQAEVGLLHTIDCPGCNGGKQRQLGTPISQISGRPGHAGYDEWLRISESYGYD